MNKESLTLQGWEGVKRQNNVCDMVYCIHWDAKENADDYAEPSKWKKECRECCHSKNNHMPESRCNYSDK